MYRIVFVPGIGYALYGFEVQLQGFRRLSRFYRKYDKFYKREMTSRNLIVVPLM